MNSQDLRAALSIKMLGLENAINLGMPYCDLKKMYNEIKGLQYRLAFAGLESESTVGQENTHLVIE
jgi:hypothetical protein